MKSLYVIPARKGSKGVPGKNVKLLAGKPLIAYTIEFALLHSSAEHICVTTDDMEVIKIVESYGISVPFVRPEYLATDTASSYDVILHAIDYYESKEMFFDNIVLLQPTSPFRKKIHLKQAMSLFNEEVEAVFSVCVVKSNPYHVMFEENQAGFLRRLESSNTTRRQDTPVVYEVNGSLYILRVEALKKYKGWDDFEKIVKSEMPSLYSIDIDNMEDWYYCEYILAKELLS